jgi:hypothetical protein
MGGTALAFKAGIRLGPSSDIRASWPVYQLLSVRTNSLESVTRLHVPIDAFDSCYTNVL